VRVPPAQIPVWRRSDIRQSPEVTQAAGSPDVKARGRLSVNSVGSTQRASNQEGRSESERMNPRKLYHRRRQGFPPSTQWPMPARKNGGVHVPGLPGGLKAAILESLTMKARKVCSPGRRILECQDRSYNQLCWEMERRTADWRMRSPSEEGWDNTTHPERGPLGPGGPVNRSRARPLRRGTLAVAAGPKVGVNEVRLCAAVGDRTGRPRRTRFLRKAPHRTERCLVLEAVLGKTRCTEF
jgi:hypothetical protein